MAYLVVSCILEKLVKGLMMRSMVPSCARAGREDRLLVVSFIFKNLEKGLMTKSLVPSCAGREDRLQVVSYILENLEKELMTRSLVPSCGGREDRLLAKGVIPVISTYHKSFCHNRFIVIQEQVTS